jgi:hypothetical protein
MNGQDLHNQIERIKYAYLMREIDYDTAKEKIEPIVKIINIRGKEIAKKHNRKYSNVSSRYLLR